MVQDAEEMKRGKFISGQIHHKVWSSARKSGICHIGIVRKGIPVAGVFFRTRGMPLFLMAGFYFSASFLQEQGKGAERRSCFVCGGSAPDGKMDILRGGAAEKGVFQD